MFRLGLSVVSKSGLLLYFINQPKKTHTLSVIHKYIQHTLRPLGDHATFPHKCVKDTHVFVSCICVIHSSAWVSKWSNMPDACVYLFICVRAPVRTRLSPVTESCLNLLVPAGNELTHKRQPSWFMSVGVEVEWESYCFYICLHEQQTYVQTERIVGMLEGVCDLSRCCERENITLVFSRCQLQVSFSGQ